MSIRETMDLLTNLMRFSHLNIEILANSQRSVITFDFLNTILACCVIDSTAVEIRLVGIREEKKLCP